MYPGTAGKFLLYLVVAGTKPCVAQKRPHFPASLQSSGIRWSYSGWQNVERTDTSTWKPHLSVSLLVGWQIPKIREDSWDFTTGRKVRGGSRGSCVPLGSRAICHSQFTFDYATSEISTPYGKLLKCWACLLQQLRLLNPTRKK